MSEPSPSFPKPAILVVDDELGMRTGIERVLSRRGFEVATASGGQEALDMLATREFPILLVDLKMPGMDGFQLLERLRDRGSSIIPIVVSAFATIESAVQTTKMGAFDFVVKPFTPDDLMVPVMRAVEKWQLAQEAARLKRESESHLLQLAREQTRLSTIIESMNDGLLVINVDGDIVLENASALRHLGRVGQTALYKPLARVLPIDRVQQALESLLWGDANQRLLTVEIERHGNDGERSTHLEATLAPVRDERDRRLGVVVILKDTTALKAADQMKNLFISMVAHEIKAPIAAVEGYMNLMAGGMLANDPDKIREIASRCLDRTGALLSLIGDLMEITRRETGRITRTVVSVDLASLARDLTEFQRAFAEQKSIALEFDADPDVPFVAADRHDMERLITNLVSNAIKYNRPNGSVRVTVRSIHRPEHHVVILEVRDTGIGMSDAERHRLGDEFYRVKNDKTRSIPGTGLGLSLVKKIVATTNGALEIESVEGQGSTFRVVLPTQRSVHDHPPAIVPDQLHQPSRH